ncbi:MAG: hypothetical protein N2Z20_04035 [Elusimicrobiales bacterium]|nr:hypothetical protein [Elusimicrobiales bacterium]
MKIIRLIIIIMLVFNVNFFAIGVNKQTISDENNKNLAIKKAGIHLSKARTFWYIAAGSSIATLLLLTKDEGTSIALGLVSFIMTFNAWDSIGKAGDELLKISNTQISPSIVLTQKYLYVITYKHKMGFIDF